MVDCRHKKKFATLFLGTRYLNNLENKKGSFRKIIKLSKTELLDDTTGLCRKEIMNSLYEVLYSFYISVIRILKYQAHICY